MKNIISGYRIMLGLTQADMAKVFNISRQAYRLKENGKVPFRDSEKILFKNLIKEIIPDITIDDIFFTQIAKKYKETSKFDK